MATSNVVRSKTATLTAATVDTINISTPSRWVEVVNVDGAAAITFTVNGTTPVADADDTYNLPAAICSRKVAVHSGGPQVKLISAGTPKYHVVGADTQ